MKEARIPTRSKFRKRRYLGDKLSAETFIPGSGFLVLLTLRDVLRDAARLLVTRRVLMIQPLDLLWHEFVFEFHVRPSSYLDSFYVLWLLRSFPVRCFVTRCLLVTTLFREASLTVATLIVRSRTTRHVPAAVLCIAKISVFPWRGGVSSLRHYFHNNYWNIFQHGTSRHTLEINCQTKCIRNDMKGIHHRNVLCKTA